MEFQQDFFPTFEHVLFSTQTGRSQDRFPMVSLEFLLTSFFRPHYGPGVDSVSNRNEYQGYFLGVKAAGVWG
jgi:hypothetical protein